MVHVDYIYLRFYLVALSSSVYLSHCNAMSPWVSNGFKFDTGLRYQSEIKKIINDQINTQRVFVTKFWSY